MSLIIVKNLSVKYNNHDVISNLNFQLNSGDFLCVVGPNGSGKTTLLKTLLGEIKPTSGKIIFDKSIKSNFIGYMPQENRIDRNFPATAYEIISTGTLNRGLFINKNSTEIIQSNIKLLGIEKIVKQSFSELSGGQRQKVLLARALCATRQLLILDEASNNLDYSSKISFYKTLKNLNSKQNLTIIMVTHDLDHQNLLGNKILSLDHDVPFFGNTTEYVRRIHAH